MFIFQKCCHCVVTFDEWNRREIQESKYGWATNAVETVKFVIIIHSEGAYKKCKLQVNSLIHSRNLDYTTKYLRSLFVFYSKIKKITPLNQLFLQDRGLLEIILTQLLALSMT